MKYTLQRCEKRIFYGKKLHRRENGVYKCDFTIKHIKDNAIPKFSNYETGIVHSVKDFLKFINILKIYRIMSQSFITGLDIGSNSLKAVVAEVKKGGQMSFVKILKTPSSGMRKGSVDDLAEMTRSLNVMFGEIKKISKDALKIFISISAAPIPMSSLPGALLRFPGLILKYTRMMLTARFRRHRR